MSLNDLIDSYLQNNVSEIEKTHINVKEIVREKLALDISEEIIGKEEDRIMESAKLGIERENEANKTKQIKVLVMETLFLGFLIGLLANQGTDIITAVKGESINIEQTLMWIIILSLIIIAFGFLWYFDKLNDALNKKT